MKRQPITYKKIYDKLNGMIALVEKDISAVAICSLIRSLKEEIGERLKVRQVSK